MDALITPTRVVAAPMAGGPSTPALVAAVAGAGGLGFLAGGYLDAQALREQVASVRALGAGDVAVNLFVPARAADGSARAADAAELAEVDRYRAQLATEAGTDLPAPRAEDDDHYGEKVDLLVAERPSIVSFTFGLPSRADAARLRGAGAWLVATVTRVADARAALDSGTVDALWVQGSEAGGHRSTFSVAEHPNDIGTLALVAAVRAAVGPGVTIVGAGGIADAAHAARTIEAGADAIAAGTAFLGTAEAGTSQTHRRALLDDRFTETAVTRVFSGRPARGLRNTFIDAHEATVPAVYPQVNQVTGPLRKAAAAAGDAESVHLWAGANWRASRGLETAAEAVAHVMPA